MTTPAATRDEFLTIIAPTAAEAMAQFSRRGLGAQGYSIATTIGRHSFAVVDGESTTDLFEGAGLYAATFRRAIPA